MSGPEGNNRKGHAGTAAEAVEAVRRWRFSLLLVLLLAALFLQPLLQAGVVGRTVMVIIVGVIFGGAFNATSAVVRLPVAGTVATIVWMAVSLVSVYSEGLLIDLAGVAASVVLGFLVAWCTFAALFREAKADGDALAGAVFGYFLLALLWGELFRAVEVWQPGSFSSSDEGAIGDQLLYLSLVTITTLGYGDVLPVAPMAQMLAGIEAAVGTLYIAILVGRIVGALRRPPAASGRPSGAPAEPAGSPRKAHRPRQTRSGAPE